MCSDSLRGLPKRMNDRCRLLVFLVLSSIAANAAAAASAPPLEDHAAHAAHATHRAPDATRPAGTSAQRWASDAALREGMGRVQVALRELHHHAAGHAPAAAVQEQATQIEAAIRFLFANCKLAPDADAALHQILLPLLKAAQRLQNNPADHDAIAALHTAVAAYPLQFDDPGWPAASDPAATR